MLAHANPYFIVSRARAIPNNTLLNQTAGTLGRVNKMFSHIAQKREGFSSLIIWLSTAQQIALTIFSFVREKC